MLQNINIQNFRCFEEFSLEGFERINLIGGKNNSGKTCLLEAFALLSKKFNFNDLAKIRNQGSISYQLLNINSPLGGIYVDSTFIGILSTIFLSADLNKNLSMNSQSNLLDINYLTQNAELPPFDIISKFDDFDQKLLKNELIDILNCIDNRIEDIRTYQTKAGLFIKLIDSAYEPLSNFGDATKNLIRYFTPILEKKLLKQDENSLSILLIDEIENGIHYSAHYDFWKNIFKLSKELNVQIFATTQSLEMIQQFNKVSIEENDGAYFEMSREYETGKIFASKHDIELLEYELEKIESTIRG